MAAVKKIDGKVSTIGSILIGENQYRVPTFQRDFAWTSEEIETLWDDILSSMGSTSKEYFIGAIVASRTDEPKKWDIVDGQQRLTALTMIFSAIASVWASNGDKMRESLVMKKIIGDTDMRTLEPTPRLTLNANNDSFYQRCVIKRDYKPEKHIKSIPSNQLIYLAFEKVKSLLNNWLDKDLANQNDKLFSLHDFIAGNIYSIFIETGDESDAYVTFETLNGRGVDLATSDLVKNLLFSKAANNIESFKSNWTEITVIVGSNDLTQFIRYFWNAYYSVVREKDLYKDIRATIKEPIQAKYMLEKLRKVATYYEALANPNHTYWSEFDPDYKKHLDALALFKVSQYKPVLLAAMSTMKSGDIIRLLKIISVISFRYTIVSSLNTGNLDRAYSSTALAISNKPEMRPKAVFELLSDIYVDDSRFESDFKQKQFNREAIARYVLREINNLDAKEGELATEKATVEHVLPKNPSGEWSKYFVNYDIEEMTYLIGNLTLLDGAKNREIGSSNFEIKKTKAYNSSHLPLNMTFKGKLHWSAKDIEVRTEELAKKAIEIWSIKH